MNALWICMIFALASAIFAEEISEVKKQEKRGVVGLGYGNAHGLGYGGNYLGGHGYGYGYNGVGHGLGLGHGIGHGYLSAPSYGSLNHAVVAPAISHSSYPAALSHGYSGYSHGYQLPLYHAPLRVGYAGLGHSGIAHTGIAHTGAPIGHGLGYGLANAW
ncbi:hypothetical protein PV326_013312 [Microctonus aethiopoides]|nr:hypothetical protein PV326_013312 [Microctonus aethiopoides]